MTTEAAEGRTELGNKIDKLMAALTRAEQDNCPASVPDSLRQRSWERIDGQEHSWLPQLQ